MSWVTAAIVRQAQKRRYQAFRLRAQQLVLPNVQVPDFADVRMVESGAFVEAEIFVPNAELPPELRQP